MQGDDEVIPHEIGVTDDYILYSPCAYQTGTAEPGGLGGPRPPPLFRRNLLIIE